MSKESIYNWIEPEVVPVVKPPMYRSKTVTGGVLGSTMVNKTANKSTHGTMGAFLKDTVRPDNFLKAHQRTGFVDTKTIPAPTHKNLSKLPAVPRRNERPVHHPPSNRNFISENTTTLKTMKPKKTPKEDINWLKSENFGKVPEYLERVKKEIEKEREFIISLMDQSELDAEAQSGHREMTDEERAELIDGLKAKWDAVNAKYQIIAHRRISTSNSTLGEIRWKESCEQLMRSIEASIDKLSIHGPIYVVD